VRLFVGVSEVGVSGSEIRVIVVAGVVVETGSAPLLGLVSMSFCEPSLSLFGLDIPRTRRSLKRSSESLSLLTFGRVEVSGSGIGREFDRANSVESEKPSGRASSSRSSLLLADTRRLRGNGSIPRPSASSPNVFKGIASPSLAPEDDVRDLLTSLNS